MLELLKYYLSGQALLFLLFLFISIIFTLWSKPIRLNFFKSFFTIFFCLLIGITLFAFYHLPFRTIMSLNFILIIYLYYFVSNNFNLKFELSNFWKKLIIFYKYNYKIWSYISLIFTFYFILSSILYFRESEIVFYNVFHHADYNSYAQISRFLKHSYIENVWANPINQNSFSFPYHYYEIWLTSLVANLFNLNHLKTLILINYPLFLTLLVLGLTSILELSKVKIHLITLFALILVTFSTPNNKIYSYLYVHFFKYYSILFLDELADISGEYSFSNIFAHKYAVISVLLILVYNHILRKLYKLAYILLLFFSSYYSVVFPVILISLVIYAFIQKFILKKNDNFLFIILFSCIYGFLFYIFHFILYPFPSDLIQSKIDLVSIFIKFLGKSIIQIIAFIIFYFIYIIIIIYYNFHSLKLFLVEKNANNKFILSSLINKLFSKYSESLILVFIIFFVSNIFSMFFKDMLDSYQFFSNIFYPMMYSITYLFLINCLKLKRYKAYILIMILSIRSQWSTYVHIPKRTELNISELNQVKSIINQSRNKIIGVFMNIDDLKIFKNKFIIYSTNTYTNNYTTVINTLDSDLFGVVLNVHQYENFINDASIPARNKKIIEQRIKFSIFYQYVQNLKENNKFLSIEDSQIQFIKSNKIEIIATPSLDYLPQDLKRHIKKTVRVSNRLYCLLDI